MIRWRGQRQWWLRMRGCEAGQREGEGERGMGSTWQRGRSVVIGVVGVVGTSADVRREEMIGECGN